MFRRRPGRRLRPPLPRRRPPPMPGAPLHRRPLPPRLRRALVQANRLMAEGQFVEAATTFERLSEEAERRDMLIRAADLTLQASRAYFRAGNVETAVERAKEAVRLLARGGRVGRVPRVLSTMTGVLREKGYDVQADQLEQEAARVLEEMGLSLEEVRQRVLQATGGRGGLPAQCSGCGAPLAPDDVEWHDGHTAECLYCGMVVKTQ